MNSGLYMNYVMLFIYVAKLNVRYNEFTKCLWHSSKFKLQQDYSFKIKIYITLCDSAMLVPEGLHVCFMVKSAFFFKLEKSSVL
jgi:hypothetical protein